jgi:hypothetical protein
MRPNSSQTAKRWRSLFVSKDFESPPGAWCCKATHAIVNNDGVAIGDAKVIHSSAKRSSGWQHVRQVCNERIDWTDSHTQKRILGDRGV